MPANVGIGAGRESRNGEEGKVMRIGAPVARITADRRKMDRRLKEKYVRLPQTLQRDPRGKKFLTHADGLT